MDKVKSAKPNDEAESTGAKREMEEVTEELPAVDKKPKIQWSCELCQTMALSELSLKERYQGKKHRSKLAASEARGNASDFSIGVSHPKSPKHENPSEEVAEEDAKCEKEIINAVGGGGRCT
ncbi:hypothetical protein DM860_000411 [Cuscuta australis]|uniref:U1-type domain-containing protein n=1 Tax=Cuscuta australis TaxID=267555 RepID=A0A328CWB8_9ASTE|nr:hypothetical protein DM860_000411 [Cuscuta australis]